MEIFGAHARIRCRSAMERGTALHGLWRKQIRSVRIRQKFDAQAKPI